MKCKKKTTLLGAVGLLAAFALWTVAVRTVDVAAIGPRASAVGFAALNGAARDLIGVHMPLYILTDWLGLVPIVTALGFALLGLVQWIRRRCLTRVDRSLFILGGFYVLVIAAYVFFETVVVNYRPVLIGGYLEVSYPSSTTLLTLCVMPTAHMQWCARIKNATCKRLMSVCVTAFTAFMVTARLLSGVHWLSDIVGGGLLSAGLVTLYRAVNELKRE